MNTAIYARVSTKDKGQDFTNQLIQLRDYCSKCGYEVVKEYIDEASGGRGIAGREAFKRLFQDAYQRKFDIVVFWALDRFSREGARETLNYLNQLESYGVAFNSFTEPYLNSVGIFKEAIIAILASLAKQEKVRISERTIAGLHRARLEGKRLGRKPLVENIDPQTLLALRKDGKSFREISKATGVPLSTVFKGLKNIAINPQ